MERGGWRGEKRREGGRNKQPSVCTTTSLVKLFIKVRYYLLRLH